MVFSKWGPKKKQQQNNANVAQMRITYDTRFPNEQCIIVATDRANQWGFWNCNQLTSVTIPAFCCCISQLKKSFPKTSQSKCIKIPAFLYVLSGLPIVPRVPKPIKTFAKAGNSSSHSQSKSFPDPTANQNLLKFQLFSPQCIKVVSSKGGKQENNCGTRVLRARYSV